MKLSKLDITVLSTAIAFIGWVISNWPNVKVFLKDIKTLGVDNWIASDMVIPRWHFALMMLLSVLAFVSIIAVLAIMIRKDPFRNILSYTTDCFNEYNPIVFEWSNAKRGIYDIVPRCPIDLTELKLVKMGMVSPVDPLKDVLNV